MAVYSDILEEFDSAHIYILFKRLNNAAIKGPMYEVANTVFVSDKFQCVKVTEVFGNANVISAEVSQGSVVGASYIFLISEIENK